jgi:two-component system sensor histidine kinase KdpD
LAEANASESKNRGKLRVFLGFAAGVGKTYAMLEAAHEQRAQGRDVVVAYVETHKRKETETLVQGLPLIPRRQIEYRGVTLEELDLDATIARRPAVALVDELAHTNAPGSRHTRRFQDVEELLAADIDVYTTLNIQHVESLNDIVAQITGVRVRETVPDRILEAADAIELVDLSPDELRQRLAEGKVYVPDQAAEAIRKFFRAGNLNALRELALRYVADRVDRQMRTYMDAHAIAGPWPANERVLICVTPGALGERLIRTGHRLAAGLNGEAIVLHVEEAGEPPAGGTELAGLMRLAEELGARTATIPGVNVVEEVLRYAHAHNVTKIVVGVTQQPWWRRLFRETLTDRVIAAAGAIDVYVIGGAAKSVRPIQAARRMATASWRAYAGAVALVALATIVSWPLWSYLAPPNLTMLYLLCVVVAALQWGRGPAVFTAALGVLAFDFFFVPPRLTIHVADTQYLLTFAGLMLVGMVISALAGRAKDQTQAARERAAYTAALATVSTELAASGDTRSILEAVARHATAIFGARTAVLLPDGGQLRPAFQSPDFNLNANELAVATWTFQHAEPAGHGTPTLPAAAARYLPLRTAQGIRGVLGVAMADNQPLDPEQRGLLEAFASLAAVAIERAQLVDVNRREQAIREAERLQAALLSSISHDLRTPLVAITGALTTLADSDARLDGEGRRELIETAAEQARRLNGLVGSLLDMTRLEAGALRPRRQPVDVQDLIGAVLTPFADALRNRPVTVTIADNLPEVPVDFVLMTQAIANVVDNAVKHTPDGTPIEIRVEAAGDGLEIRIADRGPGIPPADLQRVFGKFQRGAPARDVGGLGLGLSISAGIVAAHGGRIVAHNRSDGPGAVITITLPSLAAAEVAGAR